MDFDLKKWAPWNWFKKEQDADQGAGNVPVAKTNLSTNPPSPSLDPLLQLHREVDRLFDDAFRGFGARWPRLTLPTMQRMTEPQIRDLVAGIECPTRVIFADPAQPYLPDALRRRRVDLLPNGELKIIAGGHHLHMQQPADVAAAIGDFFLR